MNLALSNLAWDKPENEEVFKILSDVGINQIESVFTKIDDWSNLNDDVLSSYKSSLGKQNIKIRSAQSLFYGINCQSILDEVCFLNHFERLINFSKILGIEVLVFGSPNLRKIQKSSFEAVSKTLKKLDDILQETDITVVIEPNAESYGGEIFLTVSEIVGFIEYNKFKNIKTMIDTHNSFLMNNDYLLEFLSFFPYINHIHISEVGLKPIRNFNKHKDFSRVIKQSGYNKTITYEVLKCENLKYELNIFRELYS